jgi:hypothetical protein
MAGMDFDFEGALGGGFDSPGKFSYGQYNQEQMMQNPNALKNLDLVGKLQESQLNQQKKVMEMKKMEEDRQMEMLMKQAVAEASKQGPDAIASVYEQFGDAKTAMDIRQSAMALKKGGLEVNKLLTDQESAKRAAIMNQVASRIASLPANQRAQEWANLIPQVNAQMGTEIPENYSSGNLMGLMAVQRGVQDGLQTILSNPQTASMAEQPLRAMADPATEKYFNDLIASKKASLGPDLVTRANQMPEDPNFEAQRKQVREQIDARDKAAYEADYYKYKLDPETEKAKEQAQYELGQEANAEAQALSNALAELSAKEKPTAADVARVQAMADSLYETQTPLVARDFNRGKGAPASPETQQTKTFTTKTDKDGNISFSESVKEAPAKDDGGVSAAMAGLTQSLQGLDLPPSTWVDPKDVKGPSSSIGKLQSDLKAAIKERDALIDSGASDEEILAADDAVQQLKEGVKAAAKTGGGVNVTVNSDGDTLALQKKAIEESQTKYTYAARQIQELKKMFEVPKGYNPLTYKGELLKNFARVAERADLSTPDQRRKLVESTSFLRKIDRYTQRVIKGISGSAASDSERKNIKEAYVNGDMSTSEYVSAMVDLYNDALDQHEYEFELQTGKPPKQRAERLTYEMFLGPDFAEQSKVDYTAMTREEQKAEFFKQGGTKEMWAKLTGEKL